MALPVLPPSADAAAAKQRARLHQLQIESRCTGAAVHRRDVHHVHALISNCTDTVHHSLPADDHLPLQQPLRWQRLLLRLNHFHRCTHGRIHGGGGPHSRRHVHEGRAHALAKAVAVRHAGGVIHGGGGRGAVHEVHRCLETCILIPEAHEHAAAVVGVVRVSRNRRGGCLVMPHEHAVGVRDVVHCRRHLRRRRDRDGVVGGGLGRGADGEGRRGDRDDSSAAVGVELGRIVAARVCPVAAVEESPGGRQEVVGLGVEALRDELLLDA